MPRFFFHIRNSAGPVISDLSGIEFADLNAAVADAEQGISEKRVENFQAILVTDETGTVVATVPFDVTTRDRFNGATEILVAADILDELVRAVAASSRPILVTKTLALPPGHALGYRLGPDGLPEACFLLSPKSPLDTLQ